MKIYIENIKEAREFRSLLRKIENTGIDVICDLIEESINHPKMSNSYVINTDNHKK